MLETNRIEAKVHKPSMIKNPLSNGKNSARPSPLATLVEVSEEESESSKIKAFDGITIENETDVSAHRDGRRVRGRSTWITSQNNISGPRKALVHKKASLRSHYFEIKTEDDSDGEGGYLRFQVTPCGQWLVILGIFITEITLMYGTLVPSFYMDTHGLAGIAVNLGRTNTSYQQYSIVSTVNSLTEQIDTTEGSSVVGIGAIAGFFFLTTVVVPSIQLLGLLLMWTLDLSLQNQKKLYLLNEALSAWQYLEVYIIAIGVATLQMADISNQIAAPLCRDLDGTFEIIANLGIVEPIDANCFTVLAGVEHGIYILFLGAIMLNILNVLINRSTIAALQDRESRLRGDVSNTKMEQPKSFFRDNCTKYFLFTCCCCVRYVAEEYEAVNDDERDTAALASNSHTRKRTATLNSSRRRVLTWGNGTDRSSHVVDVYVPEQMNGLPPHWEEVPTEDGGVYYWHALTGETQWENPTRTRGSSSFERVEVVDPTTGRVYFWNQITGSTRWKPDQEEPDSEHQEVVDKTTGRTYLWNPTSGSTRWKENA